MAVVEISNPLLKHLSFSKILEKNNNLLLVKKIQSELDAIENLEVVLSRTGDYAVTTKDRLNISNQYPTAKFISIHVSKALGESKICIYLLKKTSSNKSLVLIPSNLLHEQHAPESMALAKSIDHEILSNYEHELIYPDFPLIALVGVDHPAVLIDIQLAPSQPGSDEDATFNELARMIARGIQRAL